ncbi:unnamed protein product [Symbiodinium necroappetens]|uniref:Ubiquitin-like domain-containing protein n=1 Tax=Symbiodinium necroappetens TaxID=1628268 RepID=A0A812MSA3_9DINO|nr:unnamed protein product [Symbiodinium necroappetens]
MALKGSQWMKKGAGKGKRPPPAAKSSARRPANKSWPKVQTYTAPEEPKATHMDVDTFQEPFHKKRLVFEARSWAERLAHAPRNTNLPASEMLRGLGPEDELQDWLASLRGSSQVPGWVQRPIVEDVEVRVLRLSGQTLSFSVASAETTRDLKQRIELETGMPLDWQVLLLEGDDCATIELMDDLPVGSYCDGTELQLILQAFHCREICLAAVDGAGKYGAMLQLLEFGGDLACCYIGALSFQDTSLRDLALQLLLKGLPAAEATRLLARALTSGDEELQRKAAMAIARWFYSDRANLSLSLQEVAQNEASLIQSLIEHLERRSKLPSKGRPWEGGPAIFVNDALTAARVTLGGYLTTARRLKPGWMYRQLIPMSGLESLESTKLPQVAAERGVSLEMLKSCLEFNWVNKSGNFLCAAVPEPMFLTVSITNVSHFLRTNPDSGIAEKEDADLWAAVAELPRLPAEHTRLALECATLAAGPGHRRTLEAACWQAGHADAAVREQAMEAIQQLAQASDLRGVHALMDTWWGTDAHVQRIRRDIDRFFSK